MTGRLSRCIPGRVSTTPLSPGIFTARLRLSCGGTSCEVFFGEFYLCLSEKDNFIPDVAVICDRSIIGEDGIYGAPSLVVEILSPLTAKRDRGYKKNAYEAAGVQEYWIVDTNSKSIEVYLLKDGRYTLDEVYSIYPDYLLEKMTGEERAAIPTGFRCSLFDDLTIRLEEVFERVM